MKVGIIGLGLIGGSMAIDLKRKGFAQEVVGVEADPLNAAAALKIGIVERVVPLQECMAGCDLIVLAVPVGAAVKMLPEMWVPILTQNRDNVLHVMDTYIDKMNAFRQAIAEGDEEAVRTLIEEANRIRRIIR